MKYKDYKEKFLNGEEIPSEIIDLVLERLKEDLENKYNSPYWNEPHNFFK